MSYDFWSKHFVALVSVMELSHHWIERLYSRLSIETIGSISMRYMYTKNINILLVTGYGKEEMKAR